MIRTRIFKAEQGFLAHQGLEEVVDQARDFINSIGEERVFQITQAAHSKHGATVIVVWYRSNREESDRDFD